jgi:hypothetical protein
MSDVLYLAHQAEGAMMYILMYIIVTDAYEVT